jgi:hypothetical protein
MKEFLFVYRADYDVINQLSPEEMQARTKRWMDWVGGIAAQNKLANAGNRLMSDGQVIKSNNVITNGPYVEIKESILGYSIVKASTKNEAVELTKGCPIFESGGNVEVREISPL